MEIEDILGLVEELAICTKDNGGTVKLYDGDPYKVPLGLLDMPVLKIDKCDGVVAFFIPKGAL